MKQLELFGLPTDKLDRVVHSKNHWKLFVDGASRNNPGPSGAGIYILKNEEYAYQYGFYLGKKTNNQAEYLALLLGLALLKPKLKPGDTLNIVSDSLLLVQQIKGIYKVRNPLLKPLHTVAAQWVQESNANIFHVLRFDNTHADAMANEGIDTKNNVPVELLEVLKKHAISL